MGGTGSGRYRRNYKYEDVVLATLNDEWMFGSELARIVKDKKPGASYQSIKVSVNTILHRLEREDRVECNCDDEWRLGYKWRLKVK